MGVSVNAACEYAGKTQLAGSRVLVKREFENTFLAAKRNKDLRKIKSVMQTLIEEKPLAVKFLDHPLKGNYTDCRECHIEPDWLLIYTIQNNKIIFVRTGSHSDLFK